MTHKTGNRGREWTLDAVVEWVDARERLPGSGVPVAAAITGRYQSESAAEPGQDFWLVRPMVFVTHHIDEYGTEYRDCFADSDGVIRLPYGRPCHESVTHWARLPALPGMSVHQMLGEGVRSAIQDALR